MIVAFLSSLVFSVVHSEFEHIALRAEQQAKPHSAYNLFEWRKGLAVMLRLISSFAKKTR
jgi:hypothetical protein